MTLSDKKGLVVDFLDTATSGLPAVEKINLFRAFASVTSQPDIAGILFSWADGIESTLQKNEQMRLNFHASNTSEREEKSSDDQEKRDHPESEDVP